MSVLGINIKKIRRVKGLNQTDFANLFGLTRANIGSYEELRAEPKIETIIKIATYYKLPIDKLVRKELTVNEISNFTALNELVIKGVTNKEELYYVSKEYIEDYPSKRNSKSFLNELPKVVFPFGTSKAEKRLMFNEGNELFFSNEGILNGDILFLEKLNPEKSNALNLGVIIDNEAIYKGFVEVEETKISITPLNPNLKQVVVPKTKQVEAWAIVGKFSSEVISNVSMAAKLAILQNKLEQIEKK